MPRILVLGAGFAGLWAALGAARKREEIGADASDTEILVIDRNPYHNIRVRNYEVELADVAIPLAKGNAGRCEASSARAARAAPGTVIAGTAEEPSKPFVGPPCTPILRPSARRSYLECDTAFASP